MGEIWGLLLGVLPLGEGEPDEVMLGVWLTLGLTPTPNGCAGKPARMDGL